MDSKFYSFLYEKYIDAKDMMELCWWLLDGLNDRSMTLTDCIYVLLLYAKLSSQSYLIGEFSIRENTQKKETILSK